MTVALLLALSTTLGRLGCRLAGETRWRGWEPAAGFGLALVLARVATQAGDGRTAAVVLLVVGVVAIAATVRGWRPPSAPLVAAILAVLLLTAAPFAASDRFGTLGPGYNNDMVPHLIWANYLRTDGRVGAVPARGYPLAPHALAGALSEGPASLEEAFLALLIAVAVMTTVAAWGALAGIPPWRRALGAVLVPTAYVAAAYFAQSSFKETIEGLFLVAFVAVLRAAATRRARVRHVLVPLALIAAGTLYNYSYFGLGWLLATLLVWAGAELVIGRGDVSDLARRTLRVAPGEARRWAIPMVAVALFGAALLVPALSEVRTLFGSARLSPAGGGLITTSNLGNLVGPIPKREIFGAWPVSDYRLAPSQLARHALPLLGVALTLIGGVRAISRRDLAIPSAALAATLIYLIVEARESAYVAAKALAILAPVLMLLMAAAFLTPIEGRYRRGALDIAGAVFAALALYSSFLAFSGAQVRSATLPDQLRSLRPANVPGRALVLQDDDYVRWDLNGRRARVVSDTPIRKPLQSSVVVDFDTVQSRALNSFDTVVTPRSAFGSAPPPNFHLVRQTSAYELWRREGTTPLRGILDERGGPGAVLNCGTRKGRALSKRQGTALVRERPIVRRPARFDVFIGAGGARHYRLNLPAGRWQLSMEYTASLPLQIRGPGVRSELPPNFDRGGAAFAFARLRRTRAGPLVLRVAPKDPYFIHVTTHGGAVYGVFAVRTDARAKRIPLRAACGRYVDSFQL